MHHEMFLEIDTGQKKLVAIISISSIGIITRKFSSHQKKKISLASLNGKSLENPPNVWKLGKTPLKWFLDQGRNHNGDDIILQKWKIKNYMWISGA